MGTRILQALQDISLNVKYARYAAARRAKKVMRVMNIEPRRGGWSGNNELGYYLDIEGSTDLRKSVLKLSEWGMPEVWSIMLGLDTGNVNFTTTPTVFGLIAELAAGSGGTTQEVEVDWVNGTCISLPMNALSVIVSYDQALSGIPLDYGTLRARVTLGRGVRQGPDPIRTLHVDEADIAPGNFSEYVKIPAFARRLYVYHISGTAALWTPGVEIRFTSNPFTGQPSEIVPTSYLHNALPDGVNVPQYTQYVRLYNGSAVDIPAPYFRFIIGV